MVRPFLSRPVLQTPFPSPHEFMERLAASVRADRVKVARLWMTEGCPAAFRDCPAVYEELRGWLGLRLEVHAKEITLVGSARLGYSLRPAAFGQAFHARSDLDLIVVSEKLFESKSAEFLAFVEDVEQGAIKGRNTREQLFWRDNAIYIPRNISAGFIQSDRIPPLNRYPLMQSIANLMWLCKARLDATDGAPKIEGASVRIYKNWESCVSQISLNLRSLAATN